MKVQSILADGHGWKVKLLHRPRDSLQACDAPILLQIIEYVLANKSYNNIASRNGVRRCVVQCELHGIG